MLFNRRVPQEFFFGIFILALELCSWLTIFHLWAQAVAMLVIGCLFFWITMRRPTLGFAFLAIEYLIGSKGALLRAGLPLRIILFIIFLLGWAVWSWRLQTWRSWKGYLPGRRVYLVLAGVLVYAVALGWWRGQRLFLWEDANAWGAWVLLLPVLDLAHHETDHLRHDASAAILAALIWLPLKTLGLFYLFSHGFAVAGDPLYLWIRRTGVGEITRVAGFIHRIFFQSHIYALFATISALLISRKRRLWFFLVTLSVAELIVSLSRSLLIGLVAGLGVGMVLIFWARRFSSPPVHFAPRFLIHVLSTIVAGCLLVIALVYAPPFRPTSLSDVLRARFDTNEGAVVSRWQLLPVLWKGILAHPILGSGFGATVTYQSQDPRVLAMTGGVYTTYAFEWGWLEQWFKFGLIGIPLMVWILVRLLRRSWQSSLPVETRIALVASLVALMVTHFFTPYLNHPLGIFFLVSVEGLLSHPYPPHSPLC